VPPPRTESDKNGISSRFILDKEGRLIGCPESHFDLTHLEMDPSILNRHHSLTRLRIKGDDYVFAAHSLAETGWHLVMVSREKDLLASLAQTRKTMKKSMSQISDYYKSHTILILFIVIFIIFLAVKAIVQPIKRLTLFAERLSEGDRSMASPIDRKDEIGVLENRFNQMLNKLIISEEKEKNHATLLEKTILDRTKELHASNLELIEIKEELEATVAKRTHQLTLLNEHLVYSENMERRTIASDLHDTIAQTLALSISKLKTMQRPGGVVNLNELSDIQNFLEQTNRGIRSLIYKMSPPILDDFDIDIALGFLIEESNASHDAELTYINNLENPVDLEKALKLMLYRATAELITNLFKYAGTKKAEIEISSTDTHVSIRVEDKGVGMDVKKTMKNKGYGFGLYHISQRLEIFAGQLIIASKPGQGTQIIITSPMIKEA